MMNKEVVRAQFEQAVKAILAEPTPAEYDNELKTYFRNIRSDYFQYDIMKFIRHVNDLLLLARAEVQDAVILDAGSGFGLTMLLLGMMGAKEVHGIELEERWSNTANAIFKNNGFEGKLISAQGDVARLAFANETFDIIFSIEAISHYHDVETFIKEAHRVLKQGGKLIISDGNNGANPSVVKETYEIWDQFENGPPGTVHGHIIKKSFVDTRKEIIKSYAPELNDDIVEKIAIGTFGYNREKIQDAVKTYRANGTMPNSIFDGKSCPFSADTGMYIERLFNPATLAKQMEDYGFSAKAYAYFGGAGGGIRLYGLPIRLLAFYRNGRLNIPQVTELLRQSVEHAFSA